LCLTADGKHQAYRDEEDKTATDGHRCFSFYGYGFVLVLYTPGFVYTWVLTKPVGAKGARNREPLLWSSVLAFS
jgi:hypothetical protein